MKSARAVPARSRSLAIGMRAAGAMALVLVLSSCTLLGAGDSGAKGASTPNPEIASAAPAELRSYYTQKADWTACEADFQCAKIKVPLDYSKPDGDSIEIAAIRLPTKGASKGSLLINPGGPGGSGYDFVKDAGATHFSEKLRANFDIVGFDPRGVKRSAPVTCLTDQERDASRAKIYDLDTDAGLAETLADNQVIAAKCEEKTGPVLGELDTESSAKDLDILRAALNDTKLNYMGFSYGTFLGSTYASLFPDNVGAMVLDGAMDPSLSYEELTSGQAKAFEKALRAYVEKLPPVRRLPAQRRRRRRDPADPGPDRRRGGEPDARQGRQDGLGVHPGHRHDRPAVQRRQLAAPHAGPRRRPEE